MRLFHIATVADWEAARVSGRYTTSTRGRTLAEEGFIHASRGDQWQGVRQRFYADVTDPLVLLVLDPDRLTAPMVDESVADSDETFPHVYGPINVEAVVQTIPLDAAPPPPTPEAPPAARPLDPTPPRAPQTPTAPTAPTASFSRIYLEEMFRNVAVASTVLACVVVAALVGQQIDDEWGPISGAVLGLVVGVVAVRWRARRRSA